MEYILENKSILLLSGILALIFVFIKDKWVSNQSVGNEKMAKIANNIADGAMSFLKAQYTMLSFFKQFIDLTESSSSSTFLNKFLLNSGSEG